MDNNEMEKTEQVKSNKKETSKVKKEIKELCEKNLAKYSWPKE